MWGSALWVGTPPIRDSWGRLRASFSGAPPTPGSSASACSRDSAAALAEPSTEREGKKGRPQPPKIYTANQLQAATNRICKKAKLHEDIFFAPR